MDHQYIVTKQVVVRVRSIEEEDWLEGQLTRIGQPFTNLVMTAPAASSTGDYRFQLMLQELPLFGGKATVRTDSSKAADGDGWNWLLEELQLSADDAAVACRLAPLIDPRARHNFWTENPAAHDHPDAPWSLWVDFHARTILLLGLLAEINSEMEPQTLLRSIMEAARQIMDAEASSLMLLDRESGDLLVQVPTGPASSQIAGLRIPAGKGLAGWVARQATPLIVDSPADDHRFYGEIAGAGFTTRNLLSVPLTSGKSEVIGVLQVMNKLGGATFSQSEIPLLSSLAEQAAIALERGRLIQESIQREVLERELSLASEIQSGFWPRELPVLPGIHIAGSSRPATQVGGDYYDVIPLADDRLGLVVADVSGKGVPAALLMATVRSSLRTLLENHHAPGDAVSRVNNALVGDSPSAKFVTLFFGVLDLKRHTLTYVNGGHNPPLLVDRDNGAIDRLEVGGPIVGFRPDLPYESGEVRLHPGHRLVMFSDGITEAQNEAEEMFGNDRLEALLKRSVQQDAEALEKSILREVQEFCGKAPQADDITLLIVTLD